MGPNVMPGGTPQEMLDYLASIWSMEFSGKRIPGDEADVGYDDLYGGGDFVSGAIGGVDRQMTGGQVREYQGIGDANMDLGGRWGNRRQQVPHFVGLTASDVYTKGGPKMKDVYWDQEPNLWNMYQHPYDASRWGDYLPGSDEEGARLRSTGKYKGHDYDQLALEIRNRILRNKKGFGR